MKILDRFFACLMILGGIGHAMGAISFYKNEPTTLLWALSFSFAAFLLAGMNLLRTWRPEDRALALMSFLGCLVSAAFAFWFGLLIKNLFDFRPLGNLIITLSLAVFSLRTVDRKRLADIADGL